MDNRDIFYLKAAGSYCELHTNYGIKVLACSLSHVYEQLNQNVFLRIHRSYAINTNYITDSAVIYVTLKISTRILPYLSAANITMYF